MRRYLLLLVLLVSGQAISLPLVAGEFSPFMRSLAARVEADLLLTEQEKEFLRTHPVIRVGIDADFDPYTGFSPEGQPEGLAVDYLDIISATLGARFEVVPGLKWSQILEGARNRDIDLIATATPRPSRLEYLNFTDFNIPTPWVVLTRAGDASMPQVAGNLAGRVAALVRNYAVSEAVLEEYPDITAKWYDTPVDALRALSTGEAEIYAGVIGVSTHLAHKHGFANLKTLGPLSVQPDGQRFAVRKDWSLLVSAMDKVLKTLTQQDHNRMQEAWLPGIRQSAAVAATGKLALSDQEIAWLKENPVIRMCVDPDWMPYEKIDDSGKHIGIAADYMAMFAQMLGAEIRLVPTAKWRESEAFAEARKCDILSMLNKSPRRSTYLDFSEPYVEAPVVLVAGSDVSYIDGLKGMTGNRLGVVSGYIYEDLIRERYPDIEIVPLNSVSEGLTSVSEGHLFSVIGSLYVVTSQMQELGLSDLKIAGRTEFTNRFRVGIRNDDPVLVSLMRKAVAGRDLKAENEILQRWMSVRLETGTDYSLLFRILGGMAVLVVFFVYRHWVTARHNRQLSDANVVLERLSREDQLTGIANRLHLDETLEREIRLVRRYRQGVSVIMFDIDHFKMINDNHGHQTGDKVLQNVAACVRDLVRETDVLGRWGGEEFVIVSPATTKEQAGAMAEKLRIALENLQSGDIGTVTASFGVAEWRDGEEANSLIRRVDEALYFAKKSGRNKVVLAEH